MHSIQDHSILQNLIDPSPSSIMFSAFLHFTPLLSAVLSTSAFAAPSDSDVNILSQKSSTYSERGNNAIFARFGSFRTEGEKDVFTKVFFGIYHCNLITSH